MITFQKSSIIISQQKWKTVDEIASGKLQWNKMLDNFYSSFHATVTKALEKKNRKTTVRILGSHPGNRGTGACKNGKIWPRCTDRVIRKMRSRDSPALQKDLLIETITLEEAQPFPPATYRMMEGRDGDRHRQIWTIPQAQE